MKNDDSPFLNIVDLDPSLVSRLLQKESELAAAAARPITTTSLHKPPQPARTTGSVLGLTDEQYISARDALTGGGSFGIIEHLDQHAGAAASRPVRPGKN
jgi:hypothetical protein